MTYFLLDFNPILFGSEIFFILAILLITIILTIFCLVDIAIANYKKKGDKIFWVVLLLVTLGLASYFYFFQRKHLVQSKIDKSDDEILDS